MLYYEEEVSVERRHATFDVAQGTEKTSKLLITESLKILSLCIKHV